MTDAAFVQTPEEAEREQLRDIRRAALDTLARREHSEQELRRKLARKFESIERVEQVIEQLLDEKLLSDERFAEAYTRYRSRAGFGPQRIGNELRERGVSDSVVQRQLREGDVDWRAIAQREHNKKFGVLPAGDHDTRARQMRFLYYRGFPQSLIDEVI